MANRRQGTHQTKERGQVRGSRRKLRRQKGTGNARVGDIKSPLFRGGGRVFGPRPRSYGGKLNQKVKLLARKSVLTYKAQSSDILVLEPFSFASPKTKNYIAMLQALSFIDQKTLLILPGLDKNLVLSSRNLKKAKVLCVDHINTYDLLNANKVLIVETAIASMLGNLNKSVK